METSSVVVPVESYRSIAMSARSMSGGSAARVLLRPSSDVRWARAGNGRHHTVEGDGDVDELAVRRWQLERHLEEEIAAMRADALLTRPSARESVETPAV